MPCLQDVLLQQILLQHRIEHQKVNLQRSAIVLTVSLFARSAMKNLTELLTVQNVGAIIKTLTVHNKQQSLKHALKTRRSTSYG